MRYACCVAALAGLLGAVESALASEHAPSPHAEGEAAEAVDYSGLTTRGIDLGEFRIRAYYPVDAQKSTVQFDLHVAVASKHYAEMQRLADIHEHKLRDEVITAARMSPLAIFDEPGLDGFRRRIYLRLRRALPALVIDDVYVSKFQLTVKSL